MPRRAHKIDGNQRQIIDALKAEGCSVSSLAGMAGGCPDLLVGIGGTVTHLVEVKDPSQYSKRTHPTDMLTDDQRAFISGWSGSPVVIICDVASASEWAQRIKGEL
jgi:hypothetical protein